jgi:CubicO group peptidase (beta-lactamase class C family)
VEDAVHVARTRRSITRRESLKQIASIAAASAIPVWLPRLSSIAGAAESQPILSESQQARMDKIASQFMAQYNVPGLSVSIARHGQLVYRKGFGFADVASSEKVTPDHLFRIASVSKPITSVAIFTLIEKGRLKLTDRVFGREAVLGSDFGSSYPERVQEITLEHLLTHTCGGWQNDALDPMFLNPAMNSHALIRWTLQNQALVNEPGTHYAYSNFGYCILGRVIEKVSGQTYAEFVEQNVLAKCNVNDMRIAGNTLLDTAPGEVVYYGQNVESPYAMNVRRMDSHGGWIATPSDLVNFAMRVDGFSYTPSILEPATIETMTTATSANPNYAKGWAVNAAGNWWHAGSLPGTISILVRTSSGLCWAALTNTRAAGMDLALDKMMWDMAETVPAWHVLETPGRPTF